MVRWRALSSESLRWRNPVDKVPLLITLSRLARHGSHQGVVEAHPAEVGCQPFRPEGPGPDVHRAVVVRVPLEPARIRTSLCIGLPRASIPVPGSMPPVVTWTPAMSGRRTRCKRKGTLMARDSHPEDFIIGESLIMFHIGNFIGNDLSAVYPADVCAAAPGWWRFNPEGTLETHRLGPGPRFGTGAGRLSPQIMGSLP